MTPRDRLRCLRRAHYQCERRDPAGRKCLAPAHLAVTVGGRAEARCPSCAD